MRLLSFGAPGAEKPGVLVDGMILDLLAIDPTLPRSIREILQEQRLDDVARAIRHMDAPEPDETLQLLPLESTRLGPPVPNASKIVCIGLNYADHAAEQNRPLPEKPLLFAKAPSALIGPGDPILLPENEQVDVEAELAVVIGRRARDLSARAAQDVIAGYMCFNDVSGRKAQYSDRQWFRGKSYDTFAPCGPFLVTADEIPDPHALGIGSRIDGRVMQESCTDQLVFRIPQLIEYISHSLTLLPGDIVATGTPAGVGVFRQPPVFLEDGDVVTVTIESLGTLTNPVRSR
jgi:2-keto-4-pentenoate hydratase/2-oxohepta-3-ene-1,7-dioic acid hydratase in catechol pathway